MKQKYYTTTIITIMLLLLFTPVVSAHHLWIEASDNEYAVIRGIHPDRIDPYDPSRLQSVRAYNRHGTPVGISRSDSYEQARFTAEEEIALATAFSRWGYRVNTTRGKRLISRPEAEEQGLTVISAFSSNHYAKTMFISSEVAKQPTGLRFEIIPLQDPIMAAPGTEIEYLVLFDGNPLSGVSLHIEGGESAVTDENGRAVVVLPESQSALLYAGHRIDVEGDDMMDYEVFTTFLTFEIKK